MAANESETLGDELRRRRIATGLGAQAAARLAGLSKRTVLDWETDRFRPSGAALDRLLGTLGVSERERAELLARGAPEYARTALSETPRGAPVHGGQVLRAMRLRSGEPQSQVARRLGVAQGTLARWEGGERSPDGETIERLMAALGASAEERLAMTAVPWVEPVAKDDDASRIAWVTHYVPLALREVALLGLEAELWRRAVRDPAAEPLLGRTVATRAQQSLLRGMLAEVETLRRRAVRLAELSQSPDTATAAVYAACWVGQRRPGGAEGAARTLARWGRLLGTEELRTWFRSAQGIALTRSGEAEAGIAILGELDRRAADRAWEDVVYHRTDLVEGLVLAGRPEEAVERIGTLGESAPALVHAKALLAAGEVPPEAMIDAVRRTAARDWVKAHEAQEVERALATVRSGGRACFD